MFVPNLLTNISVSWNDLSISATDTICATALCPDSYNCVADPNSSQGYTCLTGE